MNSDSLPLPAELLASGEFLSDPYPVLRRLREEDPVHGSDSIGGCVLIRFDDIKVTFKDTSSYSTESLLARAVEYLPLGSRAKLKTFEDHYTTKGLLHSDPPDHTHLRALVTKVFPSRTAEAMQPRIRPITNELLDVNGEEQVRSL